jgi:hypothetical protein
LVRPPELAIWDHRLAQVGPGRLNGVEGVNGPVLVGVDVDVAVRSPECRTGGSRRGNAARVRLARSRLAGAARPRCISQGVAPASHNDRQNPPNRLRARVGPVLNSGGCRPDSFGDPATERRKPGFGPCRAAFARVRSAFRDRETLRHWLLPHLTHDVTTGSALMTACADGLAFALGEMAGLVGALRPRRHPRRAGLSSGPARRLSGWKWSATAATASQARRWPAW